MLINFFTYIFCKIKKSRTLFRPFNLLKYQAVKGLSFFFNNSFAFVVTTAFANFMWKC